MGVERLPVPAGTPLRGFGTPFQTSPSIPRLQTEGTPAEEKVTFVDPAYENVSVIY